MNNQNLHEILSIPYKKLSKVFICHNLPERTFKIKDTYLPICSRCTGVYLGLYIYCILSFFTKIFISMNMILFGSLIIIPMILDGFTQLMDIRESNNRLRFISGLFGGIGLCILFKAIELALIDGFIFK